MGSVRPELEADDFSPVGTKR